MPSIGCFGKPLNFRSYQGGVFMELAEEDLRACSTRIAAGPSRSSMSRRGPSLLDLPQPSLPLFLITTAQPTHSLIDWRSRERWRRLFFDDSFLPVMKATGQNNRSDCGGSHGDHDAHVQPSLTKEAARGVPRPLLSSPTGRLYRSKPCRGVKRPPCSKDLRP